MKKIILPILAIAVLIVMPVQMSAIEESDVVTATATVIDIEGVTNSLILDAGAMNFGSFTPNDTVAKTVVLAIDNSRSASSADLTGDGGIASLCTVTGSSNVYYTVTDPGTATLTHSGGAATGTMGVSNFTITAPGVLTLGTFAQGRNRGAVVGGDVFRLGATLAVGANQAPGVYTGTFSLDIAYD